jgi:hypothetical protein
VRAAVIVAVAVSLLVAAAGPVLGHRLPPAAAARLLVATSVVVAGRSVFVTGVMAFTWIGQLPLVAAFGGWSAAALVQHRGEQLFEHASGHPVAAAGRPH